MQRTRVTGLALATVAYVAWGFLSPVGQILVDHMGPFTANAIRTLGSLPFLVLLLGPRATVAAARSMTSRAEGWILGAGWLALTLVPYLASLKYLPPTITTLTVYLTPLLVAAWSRLVHGIRPSRLLVPTVLATIVGGFLAVSAQGGAPGGREGLLGLGLAVLGVIGWVGYTIHLKILTGRRDPDELTLVAFYTSAVVFVLGALAVERFDIDWTPELWGWLAVYVLLPSVTSFFLYSRAMQKVDATTIAVLLGVELVATGVVSYFITEEAFSAVKISGLVLVVLAITLYLWDERRLAQRLGANPA